MNFVNILIPVVLSLIMYGIGLSLRRKSFQEIFTHRKALFVGLGSQMLFLPLFVTGLMLCLDIAPLYKVGFIILSACPGGTTSGFITYYFRGNTALSISLTSVNSFLSIFTIPLICHSIIFIFLSEEKHFSLPLGDSILQIMLITILPILLGMLTRRYFARFTDFANPFLRKILLLLLAIVFFIKLFAGEENGGSGLQSEEIFLLFPYALLINFLAYIGGYFISQLFRLEIKNAYTIGIETCMQNTSLAFLITGTFLQSQEMLKPALIYSLFSFFTAIVYTFISKKRKGLSLMSEF